MADARKFVVSRDVTFNESSNNKNVDTANIATSAQLVADSVVKDDPTTAPDAKNDTSTSKF